jgi:F-type H+-transporting ATPase subunit b
MHMQQSDSGAAGEGPGVTTPEGGHSDPIVLDAVGHGTPEATSAEVQHAEAGAHHETWLGLDTYGWVGVAFLIFAAILGYLKVHRMIIGALDDRASRVRSELAEAERLRKDAEGLLAEYKSKQAQAERDAAAIMATARAEADNIVQGARRQADQLIERRTRMAEDRIAAAERAAEAELRSQAAIVAVEAARRIILSDSDPAGRSSLTDRAISELDRRLH